MTRTLLGVLVVTALVGTARSEGGDRALEQLRALATQQAWSELLDRAERVPPDARTLEWRALVEKSAVGRTRQPPASSAPFSGALAADALLSRYAFLGEDAKFRGALDNAILQGLSRCLDLDESKCAAPLQALEPRLRADAALQVGKVLLRVRRPHGVMRLFARAVPESGVACDDEDVVAATLESFEQPATDPAVPLAVHVAFDTCWRSMQDVLRKTMVGASSYRLRNTCGPLRKLHALSELQEDLCKDTLGH